MALSSTLKKFLDDPEIQNLINNNRWEEIYKKLNNIFQEDAKYNIGDFTKFLYAADIDPLIYTYKIPDNFLYESDIKNFNIPKNIKIIGRNAFIECDQLVNVVIPEGVTNIDAQAFCVCRNLRNIDLPETLINIGAYAFAGCTSLTNIFIPNSVINIGGHTFNSCKNLTICCEATKQPKGWDKYWNDFNYPVVWNCNNNDVDINGYA